MGSEQKGPIDVDGALVELGEKFQVIWHLLIAVLTVMSHDSPALIERIRAILQNSRLNDAQIRKAIDQAILMLDDIKTHTSN